LGRGQLVVVGDHPPLDLALLLGELALLLQIVLHCGSHLVLIVSSAARAGLAVLRERVQQDRELHDRAAVVLRQQGASALRQLHTTLGVGVEDVKEWRDQAKEAV